MRDSEEHGSFSFSAHYLPKEKKSFLEGIIVQMYHSVLS